MIPFDDPREQQDLATVLRKRREKSPKKPWVVTDTDSYSYGDIDIRSGRMATGFVNAGVKAGDTVLIMLPDIIEYVWSWCALSKIGAIEVPLNDAYPLPLTVLTTSTPGAPMSTDFLPKLLKVARASATSMAPTAMMFSTS